MGRAKLDMQLISKEKSRHTTFKKRKEGLVRKIHEFTTLCDVKACLIIHPPPPNTPAAATETTEIWPQEPEEVSRIITLYRASTAANGGGGGGATSRNFALTDFYHCRKKKVQEELEKKRKKRMEMVYPTWIDSLSTLPETQLRGFAATLEDKLARVKSQIESLKGTSYNPRMMVQEFPSLIGSKDESSSYSYSYSSDVGTCQQFQPFMPMKPDWEPNHIMPYYQYNVDNQENQPHSLMGLLTNENLNLDHYHLGNIPPNYNTIQVAYKQEILRYSSPSGGEVENVAGGMACGGFPMPGFGRYHGGPAPLMAAPLGFQYPGTVSSSEVQFQHNLQKGKEFNDFLQNSKDDNYKSRS